MPQVKHIVYPLALLCHLRLAAAALALLLSALLTTGVAAQEQAPADMQPPEDGSPLSTSEKTTEEVAPNLPAATRLAQERRQLLSQLPGPPVPLWLPVDGEQVLAFWQEDRSGNPLGAVLMLHDKGENPRRAATLRRLHEYLPLYGWATFSMELPDLPNPAIPPRPEPLVPDAKEETETTDATDALPAEDSAAQEVAETDIKPVPADVPSEPPMTREQALEHIQRRIEAAAVYLQQQGQFNLVLLGEGKSTLWVLQYLDKAVPPAPVETADKKRRAVIDRAVNAVVLMNIRNPMEDGLEPLTDWLRHPEVPIFDVFTDFDLDVQAAARQRSQAAKQRRYETYVQRRLPPPNEANPHTEETPLTKAVRGFLQKYARGVEL
jgi:hypothetical protein